MLFSPLFFPPLALYHCSSRRGFSRANTPPSSTAPTPVPLCRCPGPGPSATACLCPDGQRGRSRLWQRRTERDRGCSTRGGLHAQMGKCCAVGSDMQPPENRAGGPCCKVAARGVGGDRSLPAASREKCRAGAGARSQGPEAEAYSPSRSGGRASAPRQRHCRGAAGPGRGGTAG